ncbi:MAG: acetate--CoA ligase family protein [Candidatus Aenigmatarchaeota archaeon]
MVEVVRDVSFRIAPVSEADAMGMIDEIRGSRVLDVFRGKGKRDKESLADLIMKVARIMMENPSIEEIDLNPVASFEKGYKVLDARIVMSEG